MIKAFGNNMATLRKINKEYGISDELLDVIWEKYKADQKIETAKDTVDREKLRKQLRALA